jgi:hypothetical protein
MPSCRFKTQALAKTAYIARDRSYNEVSASGIADFGPVWERAMKYLFYCAAGIVVLSTAAAVGQVIYNTSSTAAEGYQRGLGSIISAQGDRNLSNSQAAINLTDARSNQIDNQVKSVSAYWEKKDIYAERQAQQFAEIEQKRQRYIERRGSLDLSPQEFDRTTGAIAWPKVMEQAQYDPYRKRIDELFQKRSYQGFLSGDEYIEATAALNDFRAAMLKQKDVYPAPILEQMLRFQLKVKRELDDNLS